MGMHYTKGMASEETICFHLNKCNKDFIPPLENKVNIEEYATKIFKKSVTFEAWDDDTMVGLVAAYFNDSKGKTGYITNVSTIREYRGKGIARNLLNQCISYARQNNFKCICLEVSALNSHAVLIYKKIGFQVQDDKDIPLTMRYDI